MINLNIEITNRCRLECSKCNRTFLKDALKITDISLQDFTKIASNKFINRIFFGGNHGDCIYHPKFYEIIKIAKDNCKVVTIHTNGSGRSIQWWERILQLLTSDDELLIAMDGFAETSGIYRKNFTEKDFHKNIELLSLAANKYKIISNWMFIPFNFNEYQIQQAGELALKNNIGFIVKKSKRWTFPSDPLIPLNPKLVSNATNLLNVPQTP